MIARRYRSLVIACMLAAAAMGLWTPVGVRAQGKGAADAVAGLAGESGVRVATVTKLSTDYRVTAEALRINLEKAIREHGKDRGWMSPLHGAILAAASWRAFETEALLLSVVEYEIDVSTIPEGANIPGQALFPAATALATLRDEPRKTMVALLSAKTERQVQLLTWVLAEGAGTAEAAKRLLNAEVPNLATDQQRANFKKVRWTVWII